MLVTWEDQSEIWNYTLVKTEGRSRVEDQFHCQSMVRNWDVSKNATQSPKLRNRPTKIYLLSWNHKKSKPQSQENTLWSQENNFFCLDKTTYFYLDLLNEGNNAKPIGLESKLTNHISAILTAYLELINNLKYKNRSSISKNPLLSCIVCTTLLV